MCKKMEISRHGIRKVVTTGMFKISESGNARREDPMTIALEKLFLHITWRLIKKNC